MRATQGGWGGFLFHPNVRVKLSGNNYTEWMTFGGSGYVTAMESGNDHIDNYSKSYWFDPHDFFLLIILVIYIDLDLLYWGFNHC